MSGLRSSVLCVALSLALTLPRPAQAAFLFCNQTQSLIEAAFGYRETVEWISEGWWQIQPGQCARVFNRALTQRFYFYYARILNAPADGRKPMIWGGKSLFCVDNKAFKVEGYANCAKKGYTEQGFAQVDVGPGQRDYTLTFRDDSGR